MEAAMGGGAAMFIDGDWESICGMLSIDQDSDFANLLGHNSDLELPRQDDHHDTEGLLSLLMGDSNPITSPYELSSSPFYTNQGLPNPISNINIFPHMMSSSSTDDLSNNSSSSGSTQYYLNGPHHFVQPYNDDQLDFLADDSLLSNDDAPIIDNARKRTRDELEAQSEIPAPKRRSRVPKDAAKGKRKAQPRKGKLKEVAVPVKEEEEEEEEDRKSSYEISDNESNASQEPILNSNNGKKRANRGAATDPQSLYARKRRERINERLKVLQTLVPNGTKVDMSTMLEEAVNYVKFLQLQIKLLSSDEMWMYAPLAYNGFDVGHYNMF